MAYDIYCAFDLEKHKQTYVQYLEVVILEDGTVWNTRFRRTKRS